MKKVITVLVFLAAVFSGVSNVAVSEAATESQQESGPGTPSGIVTRATTRLSGGTSLRGEYSREKTDAETTDDWGSTARLNLSLVHTRSSENGSFSINYGQSFSYDLENGDFNADDDDLNFNLGTTRRLSPRLSFSLNDSLIRTVDLYADNLSSSATGFPEAPSEEDDGETPGDADEPTFSEKIGSDKFWRNSVLANVSYQYAKRGSLSFGYSNTTLKYDESGRDDYNRNRGSASISYGFAPRWSSSLSYSYTDARFDIEEDFTSHSAGISLGYTHSVRDSFSGSVNYSEKNYDSVTIQGLDERNDNYSVSGSIGWTHNFSPYKTLSMSAGPSYYYEDDDDDSLFVNYNVNYTSQFEHGSWYLAASGGPEDTSFDADDDVNGISEYQSIVTGVSWQMAKDLSANLGAFVRSDNFLENPAAGDEKTYGTNAGLSYRFGRWFHLSARYRFIKTDADSAANDSEEQRVWITLGASRELYRWIHK